MDKEQIENAVETIADDSNLGKSSRLRDQRIRELFDSSWATHGDRVMRFARMIEHEITGRPYFSDEKAASIYFLAKRGLKTLTAEEEVDLFPVLREFKEQYKDANEQPK